MEPTKKIAFIVNPETHKEIRKLTAEQCVSIRALVLNALKTTYKELEPCVKNEKGLS